MMRTTGTIFSALLLAVLAATPSSAAIQSSPSSQFGPFQIETGLDLTLAAGAGDTDPVSNGLLADFDAFLDAEAITDSGTRWGARFRLRAQRDHGRQGFADSSGFCVDAPAGCPVSGNVLLRSIATGRYTSAARPDDDGRIALESAHLFVRGGWGEARLGLGPGAGDIDTPPPVTAMRTLALDGGALDPGGHAAIRTRNSASGFGPRILVQSQRIVGVRVSASLAAQADGCGVDVCVHERRAVSVAGTPVTVLAGSGLDHPVEVSVSFDHTFAGETRVEAMVSALHAERSDPAWPGDYSAVQAGLRIERGDIVIGGALLDAGDYTALSAGAAYDRGPWRFAIEAGLSDDSLIHESQRAVQVSASRLVAEHALIGLAVRQEETRFSLADGPGQRITGERTGVSILLETGVRY